jgi:sugar (pentulose or hexulose) kinase
MDRPKPFAVASTGTWVIAMAVGGAAVDLDPTRDTLVNVNAFGEPVPSARFMGGREFATLVGEGVAVPAPRAIQTVLATPILLTPSVQQGSGPFPRRKAEWVGGEPTGDARHVTASFYLAIMTATALELIGADGPTIVEGPLAANRPFADMLAAATVRPVIAAGTSATGTSIGAALLAAGEGATSRTVGSDGSAIAPPTGTEWAAYAARWRNLVGAGGPNGLDGAAPHPPAGTFSP